MKTIEILDRDGEKGYGKADVEPGVSIRLYGERYAGTKSLQSYDVSFKIGDQAVYGSYNLIYTGKIVKITDKTVWVEERYDSDDVKIHRLKLHKFERKNWNFDAKDIARHNDSTSQCI